MGDNQPHGLADPASGTADASAAAVAVTDATAVDAGFPRSGGQDGDPPDDDLDVALVGQGAVPMERIKDLYVTAEAIGERRLDKHFEQLLERQRQLISDYFTNQEYRGPASAGPSASPGPKAPPDRLDGAGGAGSGGMAGQESERLGLGGSRRSQR